MKMTIKMKKVNTVYTQEMNDNGELPSAGMEFIDSSCVGKVIVRTCLLVDGDRVVYKAFDGYYYGATLEECEPLPTPVKLIDGEAYQFTNSSGNVKKGIYNEDRNIFSIKQGQYFYLVRVHNIKPLAVEES